MVCYLLIEREQLKLTGYSVTLSVIIGRVLLTGGVVVPIPVYKCTPWVPDPIDVRSAPSLGILCLRVYWWFVYCVDSVINSLYFLCLRVYWWFVCCVDSVINSLIFPIKFVFYTWHIDLYFKIKIYVWNKTQNNFFYFFQSRKYWNVHVY